MQSMIDRPRRQTLRTLAGAGVFLASGTVTTAAARTRNRAGASEKTIFEIVEESEDFSILQLALEETGLDVVLDNEDDQYTVFAPTDDAFADLLAALGITAGDLLGDPDLASILLYHVTNGRRYAASVVSAPRIEMLNGERVAVDCTTLNNGQAEIVDTDIEASNGVIHVIDGVLLPPDHD